MYVTHDQAEATTLGHQVAILKDGRLQQRDQAHLSDSESGERLG